MKKIILAICSMAFLTVLHFSCNKDNVQPNKKEGTVEFGFSLKAPSKSSAQKSSMSVVAEPTAIVVSIKQASGSLAYTMEKVELYNMNGSYISKPISLLPGSYTVEQFFVVDAAGSVIYASPIQGSPKAYLVDKPLPINFTVSKDFVTKLIPEVLSASGSTPEDFGYSTFSFEVVKSFDFLIGVFVYNESATNFELTTASLNIVASSKTIFANTLAAITNKITVNDGYDNYILTVTKDGYKTWVDTLSASELKLYFRSEDKGPLVVVLEKGVVITQIKYGGLYNWYAVNDSRGLAPVGWHVPSDAEWATLTDYLGGENVAGGKLKATTLWASPNTGADNSSGFTALPGGYCTGNDGEYRSIGHLGFWWSSTDYDATYAWNRTLNYSNSQNFRNYYDKRYGTSVRCIKDNSTDSGSVTDIDGNVYPTVKIGNQVWMSKNLKVTNYKNGNPIPEVTDNSAWIALTTGAWCAYNNDHSNL